MEGNINKLTLDNLVLENKILRNKIEVEKLKQIGLIKEGMSLDIKEVIPKEDALELISQNRADGKNRGYYVKEFDYGYDTFVLVDFPLEIIKDKYDWLADTTDSHLVAKYTDLNIKTPVYLHKNRRGNWSVSDGGHRIVSAINRGDTYIPAIIPSIDNEV